MIFIRPQPEVEAARTLAETAGSSAAPGASHAGDAHLVTPLTFPALNLIFAEPLGCLLRKEVA